MELGKLDHGESLQCSCLASFTECGKRAKVTSSGVKLIVRIRRLNLPVLFFFFFLKSDRHVALIVSLSKPAGHILPVVILISPEDESLTLLTGRKRWSSSRVLCQQGSVPDPSASTLAWFTARSPLSAPK